MSIKFLASLTLAAVLTEAGAAPSLAGYGAFDVASAYVLYGARLNKEPCLWSYAELQYTDDVWGGPAVSLWQNTDLTGRRQATMRRINEWDWTVSYRWKRTVAEHWTLTAESGHIWYKYHGLATAAAEAAYKTMMEVFLRLQLENPFLTPHLFLAHDWKVTEGVFAVAGLKRDVTLPYGLTLTGDLTAGGGDARYLACLYPPWGGGSVGGGLSYVQFAARLAYAVNAHVGIHATLAGVALTDSGIRAAVAADPGDQRKQFLWGTIGIDFAF
jgi:hypothetical protein